MAAVCLAVTEECEVASEEKREFMKWMRYIRKVHNGYG